MFPSFCTSEYPSKIASETKPSSLTSRENRRKANEEDVKYVLEELWDYQPDAIFHKIVYREAKRGIGTFFYLTRDELLRLTWKEGNGTIHPIAPNEACKIIMLLNYERRMKEGEKVPSFVEFRHTSIAQNSWNRLTNYPNLQRFVASYDRICHPKHKIEESDSFLPKKDGSLKAFKMGMS